MSAIDKNLLRLKYNKLTPRPIGLPSGNPNRSASNSGSRFKRDYKPIPYKNYFDCFKTIRLPSAEDGKEEDSFRVYLSGFEDPATSPSSLVLVLLHGGGYSGLTWSLFAKHIREICHCRVIAIDLRGHGGSSCKNESDLSVSTLTSDIGKIVKAVLNETNEDIDLPPIVIIGHSMGGALAVHCTYQLQEILPSIMGIIVIDLVEGTALDALQSMQSVLKGRPRSFQTLDNAIEWCLKIGQTRNLEAARVSMPGQLKNAITGTPASDDVIDRLSWGSCDIEESDSSESSGRRLFDSEDRIPEANESADDEGEGEENVADDKNESKLSSSSLEASLERKSPEGSESSKSPNEPKSEYIWRINLSKSEPYWKGWFQGLSELFLSSPVHGKLLLLAGIDNLDRQLTIGQMQGKFQMQVLPQCGHAVHEDAPEKVADVIGTFLVRNRFTEAIREFDRPFPAC